MEINYMIIAHKNPQQVGRLVARLSAPECHIYIHIDKAVAVEPFRLAVHNFSGVHFIDDSERVNSPWGDVGIVKATLALVKQVVTHSRGGMAVLLSGQDYPIKTHEQIKDFLSARQHTHFLSISPFPVKAWDYGGMSRLYHYRIHVEGRKKKRVFVVPPFSSRDFYTSMNIAKVLLIMSTGKISLLKRLFRKRVYPGYIKPYGGGQWWCMPVSTLKQFLEFLNVHPDFLAYHKDTYCLDEIFFQSLLMQVVEDNKDNIDDAITYVDWERKNVPLPVTFTLFDFDQIKSQAGNKLFARKFDEQVSASLLDKIDRELLGL